MKKMKQEMKNILIVGAGGIGSQLIDELVPALTAGAFAERLGGVRVHLMDSDRVEEANLSHQRHEPRMVGRLKVDSLAERLDPFLSPALGIVAHDEDLRRAEQLEGYDLVVVAVDRPAARLLAHAHATEWVDLRCGGDGYMALDDEAEARLVTLMTPDDQQPASCQQEGAVENGNIEMGYALAAAHGTQWVVQRLRRMLGEPSRAPPARMYSLTFGELQFPELPELTIGGEV
jgi:molybdopterin/thiamine biosynthesis adenylyltransferase